MLWQKEHILLTRNGRMRIVKLFGRERLLSEDNTEQSGPYMNGVWKKAFSHLPKKFSPTTLLFLGVGTGGAIDIALRKFGTAHVTGIEWDETLCKEVSSRLASFIEKGRLTLICKDAAQWIQENTHSYDLVCGDLFTGTDIAPCMRDETFLTSIKKIGRYTCINAYTHTDILDLLDTHTQPNNATRFTYYATTIGMYGPSHLC